MLPYNLVLKNLDATSVDTTSNKFYFTYWYIFGIYSHYRRCVSTNIIRIVDRDTNIISEYH